MSTTVTKADLTTYVAALEARLTVATEVYKNQRALIATLEARLATPGIKPTLSPIVRNLPKHWPASPKPSPPRCASV